VRSTLCTISFNPEKLMHFPFNSIAQKKQSKDLTCNDWKIAMFQLATARHVSGRNVTYVRLSVFLTSCQVIFVISCTFGQCPPNTITAGLRSCAQFIQLHKSASILGSTSRQSSRQIIIFSANCLDLDH